MLLVSLVVNIPYRIFTIFVLKKIQSLTHYLTENRIFQIAVFVHIAHEQLLLYSEKELELVSFSRFLIQPAIKHEQKIQHIDSRVIPITISTIPPENWLFQTRYFWYSVNCAEHTFCCIMILRTKRVCFNSPAP